MQLGAIKDSTEQGFSIVLSSIRDVYFNPPSLVLILDGNSEHEGKRFVTTPDPIECLTHIK